MNIFMILLGLSMLIYSFFEIRVYGSLYFDRDVYCIEKFRKSTKATDLVSCIHNIAKCAFGFTLIIVGLKRWMPESSYAVVGASANQWHTQKHITPENNHEVNLYRGAVRVTQQYPKHIVAMGACMLVLLVFGM